MYRLPLKDCQNLPESLQFNNGNPSIQQAITTYQYWQQIIKDRTFKSEISLNNRYKQPDIKDKLEQHYHNKCAFCESHIEYWEVEHYRPKSIYYWLVYSWDNLLLACPTCNRKKSNKFELNSQRARVIYSGELQNIHCLTQNYNQIEQPKLLHPEFDNPTPFFSYDLSGKITSNNERGVYTIDACDLNRKKLVERRKELVIDEFEKFFKKELFEKLRCYQNLDDEDCAEKNKTLILNEIKEFIKFYQTTLTSKSEFLGFRLYFLKVLLKKVIEQDLGY